jgi:hypothetical protein
LQGRNSEKAKYNLIIIKNNKKNKKGERRIKRVTDLAGSSIEIMRIGSSISKLLECIFGCC